MNRRPLCQAAVLTALGIAMHGRPLWQLCMAGLVYAISAILELRISWRTMGIPPDSLRTRMYVLSLLFIPFWLYAGWQRTESERLKPIPALEDENVVISGVLYDRQDKEDKSVLYLKDVILLNDLNNQEVSENNSMPSGYRGTCIAYCKGKADCVIGNTLQVRGKISRFEESRNPGQFDAKSYYQGQKIDFPIFQTEIIGNDNREDWLRKKLYEIKEAVHGKLDALAKNHASILQAMLLGEKSQMDSEMKELYQKSGISHLLVISGLHFSLLGMCLYELLRRFGLSFAVSGGISAVVLFLYGVMTGFGVSAVRAYIMFGISMGAAVTGREYDLPSALGASVLYLLYRNPCVLFQTGFLLSVGAILGIVAVLPVLDCIFVPGKAELGVSVRQGIRSGIAIQLATFPILLYSFYEFSPYSILLNCLVIPLLTVVILCAVGAVFLSFLAPAAAGIMILPSLWVLELYEFLCRLVSKLPGSSIVAGRPGTYGILLYYLMLAAIAGLAYLYHHKRREQKEQGENKHRTKRMFPCGRLCRPLGTLLFIAMVYFLLVWKDKSGISLSMLDVGQGQSVYIRCGNADILYDGGSTDVSRVGRYRIVPFLKAAGVDRLELVIISHLDADHYNGVKEILEEGLIGIDCLLLPGLDEPDESYQKLTGLAREKGVTVQTVTASDRFTVNEAYFHVLHPSPGYRAVSKNDTSIVMTMEYKDFTMLFTGDVEQEGEKSMINAGLLTDVDVLQLAHHGSGSSSSREFLEIVKPELALVSCGKDNRYGHPSPEVLERLDDMGICYYVTMDEGCIHMELP